MKKILEMNGGPGRVTMPQNDLEPIRLASSPCYLGDADPVYCGFLAGQETIDKLNLLLEAERAGTRVCHLVKNQATKAEDRKKLSGIEQDEAFCCAMLTRHIRRLGGAPSPKTGNFVQKIMAIDDLTDRLRLLARGQKWVADYLRGMLLVVDDNDLYQDLKAMLEQHERNIKAVVAAP